MTKETFLSSALLPLAWTILNAPGRDRAALYVTLRSGGAERALFFLDAAAGEVTPRLPYDGADASGLRLAKYSPNHSLAVDLSLAVTDRFFAWAAALPVVSDWPV